MTTTAHSPHSQSREASGPNPRAPHPTVWGVAGRCVLAAAGMMACAMSPALLEYVPGFTDWMTSLESQPLGPTLFFASLATLTVPLLSAGILLSIVVRFSRLSWRDILGHRTPGFSAGALLATTAAAAALTAAVMGILSVTCPDADRANDAGTAGIPIAAVVAVGLARAFLLQGIQEELWFRGVAFLGDKTRPWLVLGATTAAFTALHLTSTGGQQSTAETFLYLVLPLGMGFWAGVERLCTGSVWLAIGVHGGMHTGTIITALADWPLGPAAWVGVGSAFVLAGIIRLRTTRNGGKRKAFAAFGKNSRL